jgi:NAD(P)-dependent dehydrogenase (short-subunit alcohol dehydrogenase family)
MVSAAVAAFGPPTILVNNAEAIDLVTRPGGITAIAAEDLDQILGVGLKGAVYACKHVIPHMADAGGGAIVNVSSTVSIRGTAGLIGYTATKGALNALTRALAVEGAALNVRCNCIILGAIVNERMENEEFRRAMESSHLTRLGEVRDVAHAVTFLVSDDAGFITGAVIPVDGGTTCRSLSIDVTDLLEERD